MCGRTAWYTLAPHHLQEKCTYRNRRTGKREKPAWKEKGEGKSYNGSFNLAPGAISPILLSAKHFKIGELSETSVSETSESERVIQPMQWGLVPSWFKDDPKMFGLKTSNCRSESMMEKATFKNPLTKGRRCVVLAEGFYEWKTASDGKKQPYYIYFPKIKDSDDQSDESPLLTMAGVFDVNDKQEPPLYSYSVITVESTSKPMNDIHHRMPAFLEDDEAINAWLDFGEFPLKSALPLIKSTSNLEMHPVSSIVNNSRNNSPECIVKVDLNSKPKLSGSGKMMMAWLSGGQKDIQKEKSDLSQPIKIEKRELESIENADLLLKKPKT